MNKPLPIFGWFLYGAFWGGLLVALVVVYG